MCLQHAGQSLTLIRAVILIDVAKRLEVTYDLPGNQQELRDFTLKELETVRAAHKLLGLPTICGGSARTGGGGGGDQRSQICPHAARMYENSKKLGSFAHFFCL